MNTVIEPPELRNSSSVKSGGYTLRGYQQAAVDAVMRSWRQFDRTLLVMPTGAGKTVVLAAVTEQRLSAGRVLILAHREELIDQTIDKLQAARGLFAVKEKASDRADLDADIVVGSVQTLCRQHRLERFPRDHFATIIIDEAHRTPAESYQKILQYFKGAKILGVTATPDRSDAKNLGRYFEDIAFEIGLTDLIKAGYLARIKVQTVPVKVDISKVSTRTGDYAEEEVAEALDPVLDQLAGEIAKHAKGRKTLIFVPLVRIAVQFAGILCRHGFAAEMISGLCANRAEKLERFRNGKTDTLVNCSLLVEGFDEPTINCIVVLRPTKVRSLLAQMVGRGCRISPGKENLLILDPLWLSRLHNLVKPAALIAHDEKEAEEIEKALWKAKGDLVEALAVSQEQTLQQARERARERILAAQIQAQCDQKAEVHDLLDLNALIVEYRAPELKHYSPTMRWHSSELTDKQRTYLSRARVDLSKVRDRGHASAIIDAVVKHNATVPATAKQLGYLRFLGFRGETSNLTKQAAMQLISKLKQSRESKAYV